jgi:deazaflavin-dependent oxidoreductase (nitroreductase family)
LIVPFGRTIARFNRVGTNRLTHHFAGRVAPFAILVHRGRRSGRAYRTPIMAFPCEDGFLIALTYGRGTDWERNVRAAGGGDLIYRGTRSRISGAVPIHTDRAVPCLPGIVRAMLRLTRVDDYLQFHATPAT